MAALGKYAQIFVSLVPALYAPLGTGLAGKAELRGTMHDFLVRNGLEVRAGW